MPLFWKPHLSDVTSLIQDLRAKKPTLEAEQDAGMALQWDKKVDARTQGEFKKAKVAQQAYVYQTKAH